MYPKLAADCGRIQFGENSLQDVAELMEEVEFDLNSALEQQPQQFRSEPTPE